MHCDAKGGWTNEETELCYKQMLEVQFTTQNPQTESTKNSIPLTEALIIETVLGKKYSYFKTRGLTRKTRLDYSFSRGPSSNNPTYQEILIELKTLKKIIARIPPNILLPEQPNTPSSRASSEDI